MVVGCSSVAVEDNLPDALLAAQERCRPGCDPWVHVLAVVSFDRLLVVEIQPHSISLEA